MDAKMKGRMFPVGERERCQAIASLASAIQIASEGQAVDCGAVLASVADALMALGFDLEANSGGFGKPPRMTAERRGVER